MQGNPMTEIKRLAIVGAGIAGMALAILARQRGYDVTLFERRSAGRTQGGGITLWPNGVFVLQQMGLASALKAQGGQPGQIYQRDRSGTLLHTLDLQALYRLSGGTAITLRREDLIAQLRETLSALGATLIMDSPVATDDINQLRQQYDLVVGADGRMHSAVRRWLHPQDSGPVYQGFVNLIGISQLNLAVEDDLLANSIHDVRGDGMRFGVVPLRNGRCFWAAGWQAPTPPLQSPERDIAALSSRFQGWPALIETVLAQREAGTLNRIAVHDLEPLPHWHRENVVLIGDAAHAALPTSGQGACQALEDAWHLIRQLDRHMPLAAALAAFYQQRIAKTTATQQIGRQLAQQIFTPQSASPQASPTALSARQLSAFWMEGLAD